MFLNPTQTKEKNKHLHKLFEQIFHIAKIKLNVVGIPFITKCIPTINILNIKLHL